MGWEPARVTSGWVKGGTQSEDTAEVHLQTVWLCCGCRETTAAHISAVEAGLRQEEAEPAVAGRLRGTWEQQESGGWAGLCQSHLQKALASAGLAM